MGIKKNNRPYIVFLFIVGALFIGLYIANSYIGWYGYEKWKPRRNTYGNFEESKTRNVFVKKLPYDKLKQDSLPFDIYIERGFKYGINNSAITRIIDDSNYPYQISHTQRDSLNLISYKISNIEEFDSIFNNFILLDSSILKKKIKIDVQRFDTIIRKWNKINEIIVWDNKR